MIQGLADTKNCPVTANGGIVGACILFGHCFTNAYSSINQIPSFGFNMPNTPACPTASCGATITIAPDTVFTCSSSYPHIYSFVESNDNRPSALICNSTTAFLSGYVNIALQVAQVVEDSTTHLCLNLFSALGC